MIVMCRGVGEWRERWRAVVRPAMPPPIITTSLVICVVERAVVDVEVERAEGGVGGEREEIEGRRVERRRSVKMGREESMML